jgi:hypothetical protein
MRFSAYFLIAAEGHAREPSCGVGLPDCTTGHLALFALFALGGASRALRARAPRRRGSSIGLMNLALRVALFVFGVKPASFTALLAARRTRQRTSNFSPDDRRVLKMGITEWCLVLPVSNPARRMGRLFSRAAR